MAFSSRIQLVFVLCVQQVLFSGGSCPVSIRENGIGSCYCNVLDEIYCQQLSEIPDFLPSTKMYTTIHMEHQNIEGLIQGAFRNLRVLRIILNGNPIKEVISSNALSGVGSVLEELQLGRCGVRTLPSAMLKAANNLRTLHLWDNHLRDIPHGFFHKSKFLKELILWGNELSEVDEGTFAGLWNLERLDLDKNRITNLQNKVFRHLEKLKILHLGENKIGAISSGTFKYLSSLNVLNLDGNGLTVVYDDAFEGLENLMTLNLQDNLLKYLSTDLFRHTPRLTMLVLHNNRLSNLWRQSLDGLRELQHLDLSENQLQGLPDELFRRTKTLAQILLDNNHLTGLHYCILNNRGRKKLKILSLVGNPINCTCDMAWVGQLPERGVEVWGACKDSPAKTLVSVVDEISYRGCQKHTTQCND